MFVYKGEQKVKKGTYWNVVNWSRVDVDQETWLPGDRRSSYVRVSPLIMLFLGPVIGLLYVIFLPVATIAIVVMLILRKSRMWLAGLIRKLGYFEWRPSEAYLAGKKKARKKHVKEDDSSKPG